jgi:hypothetical protein
LPARSKAFSARSRSMSAQSSRSPSDDKSLSVTPSDTPLATATAALGPTVASVSHGGATAGSTGTSPGRYPRFVVTASWRSLPMVLVVRGLGGRAIVLGATLALALASCLPRDFTFSSEAQSGSGVGAQGGAAQGGAGGTPPTCGNGDDSDPGEECDLGAGNDDNLVDEGNGDAPVSACTRSCKQTVRWTWADVGSVGRLSAAFLYLALGDYALFAGGRYDDVDPLEVEDNVEAMAVLCGLDKDDPSRLPRVNVDLSPTDTANHGVIPTNDGGVIAVESTDTLAALQKYNSSLGAEWSASLSAGEQALDPVTGYIGVSVTEGSGYVVGHRTGTTGDVMRINDAEVAGVGTFANEGFGMGAAVALPDGGAIVVWGTTEPTWGSVVRRFGPDDYDVLWTNTQQGPAQLVAGCTLGETGHVVLAGLLLQTSHSDGVLRRLDENGDTLWTETFDGEGGATADAFWAIDCAADGSYVVVAGEEGQEQGLDRNRSRTLVAKYAVDETSATRVWVRRHVSDIKINGTRLTNDSAQAVAIDDATGDVFVAGAETYSPLGRLIPWVRRYAP